MTFILGVGFETRLKGIGDPTRRTRIKETVARFADMLESGLVPGRGLGIKKLRGNYWEFRAGRKDRSLFSWRAERVEFVLAGSHEDIHRFLRRL